jgi:D-alanyl-D-alanine carboxypeptidase/D-alanyl-D-alanine-endopeptidase (penicillin-binding protein 4)
MKRSILFLATLISLYSCSPTQQISRSAKKGILQSEPLQTAHIGISIFDPAANKYLYNYQGDKYFVPASNTKIPTCYAALKYLGDSLVAARLAIAEDGATILYPSGDPTFLHPEYQYQPLLEKLKGANIIRWDLTAWQSKHWGNGWSWNDYDASYMAERSPLPIYGNLVKFYLSGDTIKSFPGSIPIYYSISETGDNYNPTDKTIKTKHFTLGRHLYDNRVFLQNATSNFKSMEMPLRTDVDFISKQLKDLTQAENVSTQAAASDYVDKRIKHTIYSQPTDSLLKPLMHRSDNFFAEQSLLMASNEYLGVMSDNKIIDTLLKTHFKDLPQKPRWVDGSGLSRYNLFTPQDFIAILNKMKNEFGMERIQAIFPSGNEGTLTNYYKDLNGKLFAKTGTLSGVVALSGYMYTKKNKLLLFSVLVNNHQTSSTNVRRAVEHFLTGVQEKF